MVDDDLDLTTSLKQMSEGRHQIFKKLESIKKRMDALQFQMSTNKSIPLEILETEMQTLEEEGYRLEIQLTSLMNHLKSIRDNDRSPDAI
jgi:predicted  nucleic acid-binding Zn-ribbon protein